MVRLLAKIVAVIAIYSIALQPLLLGYLHAAHVGFDSVAVICTTGDFPNEDNGPLFPHGRACDDPCSLACNGISIAVVPPDGKFCILLSGQRVEPLSFWVEAVPLPTRYQPQAPRAPPI